MGMKLCSDEKIVRLTQQFDESILPSKVPSKRNRKNVIMHRNIKRGQQFGIDPRFLHGTRVEGYKSKIPTVLVDLKKILIEKNAWCVKGIFRCSPDLKERDRVLKMINRADKSWQNTVDVHVVATLIGAWFRHLPKPILDDIGKDTVTNSHSIDQVARAHDHFSEPYGSIILYLWDLLGEVAEHSEMNMMGKRNLAIVIAPNLFSNDEQDPLSAMDYTRKVVTFCEQALEWRNSVQSK